MDDERLAQLVAAGDTRAFEALYDRHHAALLAFCRHMLGSREQGEDALQETLIRAHRSLAGGRAPEKVRPWLFGIARNRCLTLLAARRDDPAPADDLDSAVDGLAQEVERRAGLRQLVRDLGELPDDQRSALVLAELGDLSQTEIAGVIGCPPAKVKALVFQARSALIAERDARQTPCEEIRAVLATARAGLLRRASLRKHLHQCPPCAAYRTAVGRQRAGLAIILPVLPTAGLKAAVLAGLDGANAAAAAATVAGGGAAGAVVGGGTLAAKSLVAKAALTIALGAGVAGTGAVVEDLVGDQRPDAAVAESPSRRAPAERRRAPDPATTPSAPRPVSASPVRAVTKRTPPDPPRPAAAPQRQASPDPAGAAHRVPDGSARAGRARRPRRGGAAGIVGSAIEAGRRRRGHPAVIVGSAIEVGEAQRDRSSGARPRGAAPHPAESPSTAPEPRPRRRHRRPPPTATPAPAATPTPADSPADAAQDPSADPVPASSSDAPSAPASDVTPAATPDATSAAAAPTA